MASRSITIPALLTGFALGGFVDGVLLHQILQWHHLLSLVLPPDAMRAQILWDGLFHVAMIGVAAVGLYGLWRRREGLEGRPLAFWLLAGFALWQVVDVVFFHWILGIHRVRVDRPDPLMWDIGWLVVVGGLPALAALLVGRRGRPVRHSALCVALLAAGTAGAATWALQPPPGANFTTVVFAAGMGEPAMANALRSAGARIVDARADAGIWVVALEPGSGWSLYGKGALWVGGLGTPAGCAAWTAPSASGTS
jgi:uncharacterized membrane protein